MDSPQLAQWWTLDASSPLTARAVEGAARRLHATSDEGATPQARLAGTIINPEAFRIGIRSLTRPAEVKETVTACAAIVVQWHGAAAGNGCGEHAANGAAQSLYLPRREPAGGQRRREPGPKERFA